MLVAVGQSVMVIQRGIPFVYDHNDLRGALRPNPRGRVSRGDLAAVLRLVQGSGQ